MAPTVLPIPAHFGPDTIDQIWRVDYERLAVAALSWRTVHKIPPSRADQRRLCLVAIDIQNTFCIPGFELYVGGRSGTGAVDDNRRLCQFIYQNLASITEIYPTLDTHQTQQIFHAVFLVDEHGNHPAPYTLVTASDITQGRWRFNEAVAHSLGLETAYVQRHLAHYTAALEANQKYALTIWPYHALLGGIGHALVPAIEEAIFFHAMARDAQPRFQMKGNQPLTEHYSVLGPEVLTDPDGMLIASRNQPLVDALLEFDVIVIAGQAKSHCVAWTIQDLLNGINNRDRKLTRKVYLLEDCSSPVVVSSAIDYTEDADAAYQRFEEAGMHVVQSTSPISSWPGFS
jgi:nicotinamidase-related amidase